MVNLKNKTLFITGASRGIGKAIGLRAAQDGANVVIAAKSSEPHPKLPGTIFDAADDFDPYDPAIVALSTDKKREFIYCSK